MPDHVPAVSQTAIDATEISLRGIRDLWKRTSSKGITPDAEPVDLQQELESYLNATTFSALLKLDSLVRELRTQAGGKTLTEEQLGRIDAIKQQIRLCSNIGLFSVQQSRTKL